MTVDDALRELRALGSDSTRAIYRRMPGVTSGAAIGPVGVSIGWLGMTVAFEELFGHYVDGKSWTDLAANYAIWRGRLWPLVLLMVVLAPFLWSRSPERHGRSHSSFRRRPLRRR